MRLVDLEPWWITRAGRIVGIGFLCPCCQDTNLAVLFANPPDGGPAHPPDENCPGDNAGRRWQRTGSTFDDISLSPSIDASRPPAPHWHGFIVQGEVA
jgi:hypothetical protein